MTGQQDGRPLLVVVSSLSRSSREHFFESVSEHYRIWLFLGGAGRSDVAEWELPYLAGHTVVDTLDAEAVLGAARELAETGRIGGLVCFDEARIEATAVVATALGLPTTPADAIARCRDKHLTRQALATAGVPQARSAAVRSPEEAVEVAARFGYPVVLKPRNLAASFGVRQADSPEEVAVAYHKARGITLPEAPEYYEDGVLVEEYLSGPEISIDSACFDGEVVPLAIAHKESGFPPAFEEVGHVVDAADPLYRDPELTEIVTAAHRALGFHTGMTHLELKRTAEGFKVIELNGRLGGDLIPYLGQLASGVDLSLAAAAVACGQRPDLEPAVRRAAATRFCYPEREQTVDAVTIDEGLLPPEIDRAIVLAEPGQRMLLPPNGSAWECRLAQLVAVADSTAACRTALDAAAKAVSVTLCPHNDEGDPREQ
ncbi:MAG: ATP-grasp domain-containing protein [Micromonosporaceae bacterium]